MSILYVCSYLAAQRLAWGPGHNVVRGQLAEGSSLFMGLCYVRLQTYFQRISPNASGPQVHEARQKSPILLLFAKCFYLDHFVFIPNCINQDQGRAKDRMIHLPKRGRGSNPRGVLFVHNLKKVIAVSFSDDGQTF